MFDTVVESLFDKELRGLKVGEEVGLTKGELVVFWG